MISGAVTHHFGGVTDPPSRGVLLIHNLVGARDLTIRGYNRPTILDLGVCYRPTIWGAFHTHFFQTINLYDSNNQWTLICTNPPDSNSYKSNQNFNSYKFTELSRVDPARTYSTAVCSWATDSVGKVRIARLHSSQSRDRYPRCLPFPCWTTKRSPRPGSTWSPVGLCTRCWTGEIKWKTDKCSWNIFAFIPEIYDVEADINCRWRDQIKSSKLVQSRRTIQPSKTCFNIPMDRQLPDGDFLENEIITKTKQEIPKW